MTSFRQREWQLMRFNYIVLDFWQLVLQSVRFLIETSAYENPHIILPPVSKKRNMRDKSRFSVKYPTLSCIASSRVYPSSHSRPQSRQNQIHSIDLSRGTRLWKILCNFVCSKPLSTTCFPTKKTYIKLRYL